MGGLCPGVAGEGGLCPGVGVSAQGVLCPGGSLSSAGLCQGDPLYGNVRAVPILLECILVSCYVTTVSVNQNTGNFQIS